MPILLAAFAVLDSVSGADKVYGLVFVVVLLSVATQGTLVPSVARALAIPTHERPALPWELSVRLGEEPPAAHEFEVAATSRVVGCAIRELPIGEHIWITDGAATRPGGSLELEAGDRVLLLADAGELDALARLFHGSRLADT